MADRYVDLSSDWEAAQTGADHVGNEWGGPYGLQEAGDTVAAGDTVYITGTADMRRLCILNLGKDISAAGWVVGDTLKDNNTGLEWEGVYAENINTTSIVIELIAGDIYTDITDANGVNNVTQVDTTTITSKANTFQLALDTTPGTIAAVINYIGVNAAWSEDGTRCVLDGHGTNGAAMLLLKADQDYCYFKNMEFDDGDYRGFWTDGNHCLHVNLYAHHCDSYGFYATNGSYAHFYKCAANTNGGVGFRINDDYAFFMMCVSIGNTGYGFDTLNRSRFLGCISHANSYGFVCGYNCTAINCIADGNTSQGFYMSGVANFIFGCRITNNGDYGMYQLDAGVTIEAFNFLLNNTTGTYHEAGISRIEKMDGSLVAGTEGYNDRANDDFNLTTAATLRRTEIALPND